MIDYIIRVEQHFNMMETHDYLETIQTSINLQFRAWFINNGKRGIMKKFQTKKGKFKKKNLQILKEKKLFNILYLDIFNSYRFFMYYCSLY